MLKRGGISPTQLSPGVQELMLTSVQWWIARMAMNETEGSAFRENFVFLGPSADRYLGLAIFTARPLGWQLCRGAYSRKEGGYVFRPWTLINGRYRTVKEVFKCRLFP